MKKNYLIITILLLLVCKAYAQQINLDSIIKTQPENLITYRIKARNYFLQQLQTNNHERIKKLRNLFIEKHQYKPPLLHDLEWSFTLLYLKEYDSIINSALVSPEYYVKQKAHSVFYQQFFNPPDSDTYDIINFYKKNADKLEQNIIASSQTEAGKEFLSLYLHALLSFYYYNRNILFDNNLVERANRFIKHYPESPLVEFVKHTFNYQWKAGDWNFEFSLLSGTMNVTGNYHRYFNYHVGGGFNFAVNYKRIYCFVQMHGYHGNVKKTFQTTEIWRKDTGISAFISQLAFGYSIVDTRIWELTPYIGISWFKQSVLNKSYYSTTIVNDIYFNSNQLFGCRLKRNVYRLPLSALNRSRTNYNLKTAFVFADGGFMLLNKTSNVLPRGDSYYFILGFGLSFNKRKL